MLILNSYVICCNSLILPFTDAFPDSPQLSTKDPLTLLPQFQLSSLSLPGQQQSPLHSPILSEVGSTTRLEEEEEGRRKVRCSLLKSSYHRLGLWMRFSNWRYVCILRSLSAISHWQGLLHRQRDFDHRADVPEGPWGHHSGELMQLLNASYRGRCM